MKHVITLLFVLAFSYSISHADDIWYKTDFPESEQVKEFSTFGRFILTESGNIYINDSKLHWELIHQSDSDIIPTSISCNSFSESDYGVQNYTLYIGTNKGVFKLNNEQLTHINLEKFTDQPVNVLGQSRGGKLYFNTGSAGLFFYDLEKNVLGIIHYLDSIPYRAIKNRKGGIKIITNNNEMFEISDTLVQSYYPTFQSEAVINDFNIVDEYTTATKKGLFAGTQLVKNLEDKNCIEIAVNDFAIINKIYDPNHVDTTFFYYTPFVATAQNGVFVCSELWNTPPTAYPINGGLEDTNMTHIAINDNFQLLASTKYKGVYKTAQILFSDVNDLPQNDILISPNPVASFVQISTYDSSIIGNCQIYDIFGNLVMEISGNQSEELNINLSALSTGTYYIKTMVGGKLVTKKLVKI